MYDARSGHLAVRAAPTLSLLAVLLAASPARSGGLFVASQDGRSVLEYDATSGAFERVVAESVSEGFHTLGGIALRPSDGVLHVSSTASGEIWRYATVTGEVIAPALASGLQGPRGMAFDASGGTLFFADPKDSQADTTDSLKALALPAGTVTTLGTLAGAEFCGVAVNGAEVFATDTEGNRVVRFPAGGGSGTTVIASGLSAPTGLLFRSATRMLVADGGSNRVLEYRLDGASWVLDRVVLPASAGVVEPCGLALAPDGRLSVSGCGSHDVVQVDLATLEVAPLVAPGTAGLATPKDLAWSGSTLLVASAVANAVVYFDASGQPTGVRAQGISAALDGGIAFSPDGQRLLVVSALENAVLEHDAGSGLFLRRFGNACLFLPWDLAWGPDGRLYVACFGDSGVSRIDPVTGSSLGPFVLGGSGGLSNPRGLAFGPNGDLYVSSTSGEVLEYDGATGAFVGAFVDASGNGGGPVDPYGLAFHQGRLYVASFFPSEVKAFDAATGAFVSTFVPSGSGGLSGPTALAFGPGGDLFVTSRDDDAARRYDGATGAFVSVFVPSGSGGLDGPFDLAFRPSATPAPVPSLSPAGRAALVLALAAVAGIGGRGRRGASISSRRCAPRPSGQRPSGGTAT
jgi:DNA-binding beta-propeller fold protein YncE